MIDKQEIRLENVKSELYKAQVIAEKVIADINESGCSYAEKQVLDAKARIVGDYLSKSMDGINEILEEQIAIDKE